MSPSPSDLESVIVDALEAVGADVEPGTDAAWRRFEGAARRRRRHLGALLIVGATATAAAVIAAVVLLRDPEPQVRTDPASPDPTTEVTVPADLPEPILAVRDDGKLVLLDGAGRVEREVELRYPPGLGPIGAVELSPDGRWLYFSTGNVGNTYRVPATGGEVQRLDTLGPPAVSPDGTWVAGVVLQGQELVRAVARADGMGDPVIFPGPGGGWDRSAWSPDGRRVAFVDPDWQQTGVPHVVEQAFDGTALGDPVDRGSGQHVWYSADGSLQVRKIGELGDLRAWSPAPAASWVLEVTSEGALQYRNPDDPDSPPVVLGRGYLTADW